MLPRPGCDTLTVVLAAHEHEHEHDDLAVAIDVGGAHGAHCVHGRVLVPAPSRRYRCGRSHRAPVPQSGRHGAEAKHDPIMHETKAFAQTN